MDKETIKNILPRIYMESFKRLPYSKVFFSYENIRICEGGIDADFVNESIDLWKGIDYLEFYRQNKAANVESRNVYTISCKDHFYLAYLILEYADQISYDYLNEITPDDVITYNSLFQYKRYYGFDHSSSNDFYFRDIKNFYYSLKFDKIYKYLPKDKAGFLSEILDFYKSAYEIAGLDFGLILNAWHSWVIADIFLLELDKEFQKLNIPFCREGDAYLFSKEISKDKLNDVDRILLTYGLDFHYHKERYDHSLVKKAQKHMELLKDNLLNIFFPVKHYAKQIRGRRNVIAGILQNKFNPNVNKQKMVERLLKNYTWNSLELYHIMDWAIQHKLNIRFYDQYLISTYKNAHHFLRSQIRRYLYINDFRDVLNDIMEKYTHCEIELQDYHKMQALLSKN